ncbi:hypothetical protein LK459_07515 [Gordonia otitidis]|uniref:hypothetical protein n=1 Tax=Gordonia otitidis TaxID=249058 RepID=UPI001D151FE6|nr:hypothetical protein [Gordonia otitidis]UEA60671.1 hypothetical protein LK459_07515 [Gordonia otitidis]
MSGDNDGDLRLYEPFRRTFSGRTMDEETECFKKQARRLLEEVRAEFTADDNGVALSGNEFEIRRRLVATLFRDLIDLKNRAKQGCVHGSGLRGDRDSEWCFPLEGNENQLGELRHPVTIDGEGETDIFGWQFRMYFAAPLVEPALLLWLVFARKPSGKVSDEWRDIQSVHIGQSKAEFSKWRDARSGNRLTR